MSGRSSQAAGRGAAPLLAALIVATVGAAGCDDSVRFRLRVQWARSPGAQACPTLSDGSYTCAAIPLTCDARVRVRILDAASGQPYYSECFSIRDNGDACQLADLAIEPRAIPNEMVRVQVIVWTVAELARSGVDLSQTDGCPVTTEFTGDGLPRLVSDPTGANPPDLPVPALGGEAYFDVGKSPVATVTLGCPGWDQLDAPACRNSTVLLEATIRDPRTFGSVLRTQAEDMEVRFGVPVPGAPDRFRVDLDAFSPALAYTSSGPLVWQANLEEAPTGTRCLRVAAQGVAAPTIACFPTSAGGGRLRVDGFLVGRVMLRDLLDLQSLFDLPEEGMVIGVVVDATGQPVRGAMVSTTDGALVVYPDDNLQTVGFAGTDGKGYFLSSDAGFESVWQAAVPGGLTGDGEARGGLVDNHVSVVVIRLTGVVSTVDAGLGGPGADAGVGSDAGHDAGIDGP